MTDYTYCNHCEISIPYIKDKDRYVTCPKCYILVEARELLDYGEIDTLGICGYDTVY